MIRSVCIGVEGADADVRPAPLICITAGEVSPFARASAEALLAGAGRTAVARYQSASPARGWRVRGSGS